MSNETKIVAVNGTDRDWTRHRYVLAFGANACTRLMAWANSLDDALDACGEWIGEHAPGLFHDDAVADEYRDALAEGLSEEEAMERSEVDMTHVDGGHYLASWEWSIVAVDPTRAQVLALQGRADFAGAR